MHGSPELGMMNVQGSINETQNANQSLEMMDFEHNADQEENVAVDITLSDRDSLMNEMNALHKQIIEQICNDQKVVLEMR